MAENKHGDSPSGTSTPGEAPASKAPVLLSKSQIMAADDRQIEEVPVPEWGGVVLVRGLSGTARDRYFADMAGIRSGKTGPQMNPNVNNSMARLVARCVLDPEDPDRDRLMLTVDDVVWLGKKSARALGRVEEAAMRLSGLGDEEMELLGKDSPDTPSGDSTSS